MFLIGSRAAQYHGLRIPRNIDKSDWDIVGSKAEMSFFTTKYHQAKIKETPYPGKFHILIADQRIEFDATENESNQILERDYLKVSTPEHFTIGDYKNLFFIPPKSILYDIKRSHANFATHFEKTLMDLRAMMKQWCMGNIDENKSNFFKARKNEAKIRFGEKQNRIKLNKPVDDFFKGSMGLRTYVHDDLHRAVAYYDGVPMFTKCQPDPESAWISKDDFFAMSLQDQRRMAMEESMVIALERIYIPNREKYLNAPWKVLINIYRQGMMKQIKDLSKGWFQDFMIDEILEIENPQWNYVEKFEQALKAGKLRTV